MDQQKSSSFRQLGPRCYSTARDACFEPARYERTLLAGEPLLVAQVWSIERGLDLLRRRNFG
jgi:hypothetical protein